MLKYILVCIVAFAGFRFWYDYPIHRAPGEVVDGIPQIHRTNQPPFDFEKYTITPLRSIEAEARIIKRRRYFFDAKSDLSPIDVLVGWNEMSDERNLNEIHFSLKDRYYDLDLTKAPFPLHEIKAQIGLWHLIPANKNISDKLKKLRSGHILTIEGYIVNVESLDEVGWKSELEAPRNGHLKNSIIWVEHIQLK
ncbi:MAG TPA: hypothetical protein DEQ34_11275 [Balneolaceae bacterium]|nr:hypothetical protein [Balneolaceae bacterium]|tara:strand:- start:112470 stop:113051 length:582 start_codon:yes stop_codon:yes gene_type:complete